MNILIFTTQFYQLGGQERLAVELAVELNRQGTRASLMSQYAYNLPSVAAQASRLKAEGIPEILYLGLSVKPNFFSLINSIFRFRKLLRLQKYDAVEVSGFTPSLIASLGSLGLKVKVLVGVHAQYHLSREKGLRNFIWRHILRLSKQVSFYAVSQSVKCDWITYSKIQPSRTAVIMNSINSKFYARTPASDVRKKFREGLGIDSNAIIFLFVGRLLKSKGIEVLLESVKPILKKYNNYYLVYVGGEDSSASSSELVSLKNIKSAIDVESLGQRVHFLGTRSDVSEIMAACDLLVHPALHEGFGLIIAEALAVGIPVVASSVGGIPEVLEGTDSIIVPPNDPEALTAAIISVLEDPKKKLNEFVAKRKFSAEKFRVEKRARAVLELLKNE
jgi:glycosyltransferase involved in cell wall biosynthesis